jgi:hypothetical protein
MGKMASVEKATILLSAPFDETLIDPLGRSHGFNRARKPFELNWDFDEWFLLFLTISPYDDVKNYD